MLTLDNGVVATVHASRDNGAGQDVRLGVAGTTGNVAAGWGPKTPVRVAAPEEDTARDEPWAGFIERFTPAYRDEIDAFVDFVIGHGGNPCSADDALAAARIAEAATESMRTGRPMAVEPNGIGPDDRKSHR
jgi:myo-inositol 2-dehydrogenase / D-chiro-inositol 1-dehydrogenase